MGLRSFFGPSANAMRPAELLAAWAQGIALTLIAAAIAFLNAAGPLVIGLVVIVVALLSFLVFGEGE
jgi:hypothetical protein